MLKLAKLFFIGRVNHFLAFGAFALQRRHVVDDFIDFFLFKVDFPVWPSPFEVLVHQKLLNSVAVKLNFRNGFEEAIIGARFDIFEVSFEE